jgi:magnesium chelatase subunit D
VLAVGGTGTGTAGRRSAAWTSSGRTVGARRPTSAVGGHRPGGPAAGSVHLPATLRAAAPHQGSRERTGAAVALEPDDLRVAVRHGRESNLVLLCVDASGSMAARRRMEQVKTAVLSLLLDAYQRRDRVGLVTFRGDGAELVLPPTGSTDVAATRLRELATGGRTPLAEGLLRAAQVLRVEGLKDPHRRPLLVVVTDGRATSGPDALGRSRRAADLLAGAGVACVVVDCETGRFRMQLAAQLAERLGAEHVPVAEVTADAITSTVRATARRSAA